MPANERLDAKCGPFGNLWQAYANALDGMARSCEPAAVGIGRWQLELTALGLRRTQAWLEIPARLGQCRTPQDLFGEQLRFWQTASAHYSEGGQRLLATVLSVVPPAAASGRREGGRDFIAVSQAREPAPAPAKDRRAA